MPINGFLIINWYRIKIDRLTSGRGVDSIEPGTLMSIDETLEDNVCMLKECRELFEVFNLMGESIPDLLLFSRLFYRAQPSKVSQIHQRLPLL